jgi:hypothetical protein
MTRAKHTDQSVPIEWHAYEHNGETYVVHKVPEGSVDVFRVADSTRNPRVMFNYHAVLYNGNLLKTLYDGGMRTVTLHHTMAGRMASLYVGDMLDEPVVCLERLAAGADPMDGVDR